MWCKDVEVQTIFADAGSFRKPLMHELLILHANVGPPSGIEDSGPSDVWLRRLQHRATNVLSFVYVIFSQSNVTRSVNIMNYQIIKPRENDYQ